MRDDDDDLQELIDAHYGRLIGLLRFRGCTNDEAEDLAQEALLRLVQRWDEDPIVENWWAWLVTVAVNLHVSRWRRLGTVARRGHLVRPASEHHDTSVLEALDVVRDLTPRQRTAVVLRYYAGLSAREAAEAMGVAEGTVRSLAAAGLSAARQQARKENQEVIR